MVKKEKKGVASVRNWKKGRSVAQLDVVHLKLNKNTIQKQKKKVYMFLKRTKKVYLALTCTNSCVFLVGRPRHGEGAHILLYHLPFWRLSPMHVTCRNTCVTYTYMYNTTDTYKYEYLCWLMNFSRAFYPTHLQDLVTKTE